MAPLLLVSISGLLPPALHPTLHPQPSFSRFRPSIDPTPLHGRRTWLRLRSLLLPSTTPPFSLSLSLSYDAAARFRLNWVTSTWKSPTGLPRDPPLAAHGEKQAQELADYFLSLPEDERPTAIFSSPYYRCLQTSQPTAKALGLPIHIEHGIAEWYSPVVPGSGLHPRPGLPSSLVQHFPEIDTKLWPSPLYYPSRKGETVEEVHLRVDGFLSLLPQALAQKAGEIDMRRPLFVSHAATAIVLVRELLGDRELPLKYGCCSLSELVRKDGVENGETLLGAYRAVKLADGSHLKEGASREWGFDDIEVDKGRVVEDPGVPGTEGEDDWPVGPQKGSV
ncbi:hypothetical protein NMY22_g2089 [Coprinellus aureogranulatus]|nr:hypothetical protein NMY22_g2089 [Coprinellus aureogranulatus]